MGAGFIATHLQTEPGISSNSNGPVTEACPGSSRKPIYDRPVASLQTHALAAPLEPDLRPGGQCCRNLGDCAPEHACLCHAAPVLVVGGACLLCHRALGGGGQSAARCAGDIDVGG